MPKGVGPLWMKCLVVMDRVSPMLVTPDPSDNEASVIQIVMDYIKSYGQNLD
jgi:hypothetical protein